VRSSRPGSSSADNTFGFRRFIFHYQLLIQTESIVGLATTICLLRMRDKIHLAIASDLDGSNDQFLECANG
jgi:hypothetical protein